jgi:hypothetical protein
LRPQQSKIRATREIIQMYRSGNKGERMKHNTGNMTVKELRDKLTTMPDDMDVVVYWEDGAEHQCFGIDEVSAHKGNPCRTAGGKAGFQIDSKGLVTWLFISVSPE